MSSTDRNRMTRTSNVFITYDENTNTHKVHAPGNVEGVDMAHAYGANRDIYWIFHNQTSADVTVKMKFDPALFKQAFDSTDPVAQNQDGLMTITKSVPRTQTATVKGDAKKPFWGWELGFGLFVNDTAVDPGIRIDDGKALIITVASVSFAAGLVIGSVFL